MTKTNRVNFLKTIACIVALLLILSSVVYYKTVEAVSGGNAGDDTVQTVKIAYLPITHALPVFELKDELEAQNSNLRVELVKYSSWAELLDALNAGQVDGASVLVELAMKAKEGGVDLKLAALGHKDGNVIVTNDSIVTADDLKGKTVAIPHRQSSHNILINLELARVGLTVKDIQVVELAPTEMPSALASGQIDAYCVAEPFGAKGVALGGHVLDTSEQLWQDSICCGLVFYGKFATEHSDTVDQLLTAYTQAGNTLTTDKAFAVAQTYLGQDDAILETSLQWISYADLTVTKEAYESLCAKMVQFGLTDAPPTYEEFVYSTQKEVA